MVTQMITHQLIWVDSFERWAHAGRWLGQVNDVCRLALIVPLGSFFFLSVEMDDTDESYCVVARQKNYTIKLKSNTDEDGKTTKVKRPRDMLLLLY